MCQLRSFIGGPNAITPALCSTASSKDLSGVREAQDHPLCEGEGGDDCADHRYEQMDSFRCRRIHQRPQQEQHNRVFEDIDGVGVRGERP